MSLVIHYWIGDVQDCQGVSASEMTYIVSSGALNSTHSFTLAVFLYSELGIVCGQIQGFSEGGLKIDNSIIIYSQKMTPLQLIITKSRRAGL